MKKTSVFLVLSLLFFTTVYSQSTDRFIRIIGNANHSFESNVARVYFGINEIVPNEYKKISYKSYDTSYAEFLEDMKKRGFKENQIIKTDTQHGKYHKGKSKYYYIDITDKNKLSDLRSIQTESFSFREVKFFYTNIDENIESNLSFEAIKDAKRKAKKICEELNMELGKVLNIEDRSNGCCSVIKESKASTTDKEYNITITFELLDK